MTRSPVLSYDVIKRFQMGFLLYVQYLWNDNRFRRICMAEYPLSLLRRDVF